MDETFNDIKQTAIETQRVLEYLDNFIGGIKKNMPSLNTKKLTSEIVKTNSELPFIFTGQITDLCYFQNNEIMPISAIAEIEDESLKQAVKSTFEECSKNKLVSINDENGTISLTKKGKKYINKESFVKQAKQDQLKAFKAKLESLKNQSKTASTGATSAKAGTNAKTASSGAKTIAKVLKKI